MRVQYYYNSRNCTACARENCLTDIPGFILKKVYSIIPTKTKKTVNNQGDDNLFSSLNYPALRIILLLTDRWFCRLLPFFLIMVISKFGYAKTVGKSQWRVNRNVGAGLCHSTKMRIFLVPEWYYPWKNSWDIQIFWKQRVLTRSQRIVLFSRHPASPTIGITSGTH